MEYDDRPFTIWYRTTIEVNTDPQRRCYNGCHYSSELRKTEWEVIDRCETREKADRRLKFWTELNDYAVSQRGTSAQSDYKIEEVGSGNDQSF